MNGTVHAPNSGFVTFDAYSGGGGGWERERGGGGGGEEGEREKDTQRDRDRRTETQEENIDCNHNGRVKTRESMLKRYFKVYTLPAIIDRYWLEGQQLGHRGKETEILTIRYQLKYTDT